MNKIFLSAAVLAVMGCASMPQRTEIQLPVQPEIPVVHAKKADGGVFIPEKDFITLVQYVEKMKGHVKELNAVIEYYKGDK